MQTKRDSALEALANILIRMGVAFTLSAADTDALINRITGGFKYDVANEG